MKRPEALTDEQRALAEEHVGLARAIARRVRNMHPWQREEVECSCFMALCEAAKKFEAERDLCFSTYATHKIQCAVLDWFDPKRNRPGIMRVKSLAGEQEEIRQAAAKPDDGWRRIDDADELEVMFKTLSGDEAAVCRERLKPGATVRSTGRLLGVSSTRVSQLQVTAIQRMRGELLPKRLPRARLTGPLGLCKNCGRLKPGVLKSGRCIACYNYLYCRHVERPEHLWDNRPHGERVVTRKPQEGLRQTG